MAVNALITMMMTIAICNEEDHLDDKLYGVLVHVDHMNDRKAYEKWLQKACNSTGCSYILKRCYKNDNPMLRPIIFVCLLGDERIVRQVMKRWRTSRVDDDSKGNPCLERMMHVLAEGDGIDAHQLPDMLESLDDSKSSDKNDSVGVNDIGVNDMKDLLKAIGGTIWEDASLQTMDYKLDSN